MLKLPRFVLTDSLPKVDLKLDIETSSFFIDEELTEEKNQLLAKIAASIELPNYQVINLSELNSSRSLAIKTVFNEKASIPVEMSVSDSCCLLVYFSTEAKKTTYIKDETLSRTGKVVQKILTYDLDRLSVNQNYKLDLWTNLKKYI